MAKCVNTGSEIGSFEWGREPGCMCRLCEEARTLKPTNAEQSKKREFIAVKFEIELPLKKHQLNEAIGLLGGLLEILKSARDGRAETT